MKILNLDETKSGFRGVVEIDNSFKDFYFDTTVHFGATYPKRDYDEFAAIYGKFDPYIFILSHPIEIESLTLENLADAYKIIKGIIFFGDRTNDNTPSYTYEEKSDLIVYKKRKDIKPAIPFNSSAKFSLGYRTRYRFILLTCEKQPIMNINLSDGIAETKTEQFNEFIGCVADGFVVKQYYPDFEDYEKVFSITGAKEDVELNKDFYSIEGNINEWYGFKITPISFTAYSDEFADIKFWCPPVQQSEIIKIQSAWTLRIQYENGNCFNNLY